MRGGSAEGGSNDSAGTAHAQASSVPGLLGWVPLRGLPRHPLQPTLLRGMSAKAHPTVCDLQGAILSGT
jgi:hypothetical protein